MARKHRKFRGGGKSHVQSILITPEKVTSAIKQNPVTGEFEIVKTVTPAVYKQGKAYNSTSHPTRKNGKKVGK